jgi:hypothetical protein
MKKRDIDWVVMGRRPDSPVDEHAFCKRCGAGLVLMLPLEVGKVVDLIEQFCAMHKNCLDPKACLCIVGCSVNGICPLHGDNA